MSAFTEHDPTGPLLDTSELLQLVIAKLASQSLLFGISGLVVLLGAWFVSNGSLPLVGAVLVVFTIALSGYLFVEQKGKIARGDPVTMSRFNRRRMTGIKNPTGAFGVELWTEPALTDVAVAAKKRGSKYRTGQSIVIGFRTTKDCYLTLLNLGSSGKLTVLFPNAQRPTNFIQADTAYRIPGDKDGFKYELQGPPGVERLKAVATLKSISLLASDFAPDGSIFRTVDAKSGARDIAVVQETVAELPRTEWAESECEFTVA